MKFDMKCRLNMPTKGLSLDNNRKIVINFALKLNMGYIIKLKVRKFQPSRPLSLAVISS